MDPCKECGAELIRTSERYCCCPNGHGKLVSFRSDWRSNYRNIFRPGIAKREDAKPASLFAAAMKRYDRVARMLANWRPSELLCLLPPAEQEAA